MRQHLAYFEVFDFTIKGVKPLTFAKVVFRKKNLGCFTFFPIHFKKHDIDSLDTEYIITDWQECISDTIVTVSDWCLLSPEHIDNIYIYKNE